MSEIESKEQQTKPDCRAVAVQNSPDYQEVAVQTHSEATAAETIGRSTTFVVICRICNIQMGLGAACLL